MTVLGPVIQRDGFLSASRLAHGVMRRPGSVIGERRVRGERGWWATGLKTRRMWQLWGGRGRLVLVSVVGRLICRRSACVRRRGHAQRRSPGRVREQEQVVEAATGKDWEMEIG